MPQPSTIAVIDIGKTNAKVVLVDALMGSQIGVRSMPNPPVMTGPYPHADVEGIWEFVVDATAALNAVRAIEAISITTHGATGALMVGERLALPVLDYEFDGPEAVAGEYGAVRPEFGESYSPKLPGGLNLGAQIFWQSQAFGAEFSEIDSILTYPQYWGWRLTGVKASEVTSLGCHTDLWAPDRGDFSAMVDAMGWRDLFPPVRAANSVIGVLRDDLVARMGLGGAVPVSCGIHDSNASLLPHLNGRETPFTVISSGTWTICMTVGGTTAGLDAERDSLANVDAFGRAVPTARFMGGREFDLLGAPKAVASVGDLAAVIEKDIFILPGTVPGVGPFPHGRGGWSRAPETLSDGERAAALALYLALVTEAALTLCGVGKSIVVEGPFARNDGFGAALGVLTGVPVLASADATGTALGAAMLFGQIAGAGAEARAIEPLSVAGLEAYRARWLARSKG